MRSFVIGSVLAAALAFAPRAFAHGGDDHGAAPPPPAPSDAMRVASAASAQAELVLRWPAQPASASALSFRALLADFATNTPIEGATLDAVLSAPGKDDVRLPLGPTSSPGVYVGQAKVPADGAWSLALTVVAGALVAPLAIAQVEIGALHDAEPNGDHDHAAAPTVSAGGVLGLVGGTVLFAALFFWLVRKKKAPEAAVCVALALASGARAHGGEEHAHEDAPAAVTSGKPAPGRIFLAKESQFLLGVRTLIASETPLAERVIVSGVVSAPPERHAAVFVPQSGRITAPSGGFPQLGARVRRGQTLGVVDAVISASERATFLSEAARAEADLAAGAARLEAAQRALARLESLGGVSSQQQLDAARVDVTVAQGDVDAARARASAFATSGKGTSARFELTAPLDGVLADINVSPGETLTQGERAFLIIDPKVLTIEAKVPEHEIGKLRGSKSAVMRVDAFPERTFAASLAAEGQVIDDATRTVKVIFAVPNDEGLLKLGMFAQVQIGTSAEDRHVIAVPDAALVDVEGRRIVFVHVAAEEFEAREVQLGTRDGDRVEIVRGVRAGERVVVSGAYTLRSAQR